MGAQPKRRISKGRKGRRRAHNALSTPTTVACPKCGKLKRTHFACEFCGHYGPADQKKSETKAAKKSVVKTKKK